MIQENATVSLIFSWISPYILILRILPLHCSYTVFVRYIGSMTETLKPRYSMVHIYRTRTEKKLNNPSTHVFKLCQ